MQHDFKKVNEGIDGFQAQNINGIENVKVLFLYFHLPRFYRNSYDEISADKIDVILKSQPVLLKPEDFGFIKNQNDPKYFKINEQFENQSLQIINKINENEINQKENVERI